MAFVQALSGYSSPQLLIKLLRNSSFISSFKRGFHSNPSCKSSNTVLAYDHYEAIGPVKEKTRTPLLILHGLFGSKQNWKTLAKNYAGSLHTDVYALDLRNHGESPHIEPLNYKVLADDVFEFLQQEGLEKVSILGHSMGGKVAMALSLNEPTRLEKLVVVDMSPVPLRLSDDISHYIDAMKKVEESQHTKQSAADAELMHDIPDIGTRLFLMTNLRKGPKGTYVWRIPLDIIQSHLQDLSDFPINEGLRQFGGPTLFVSGSKSHYVQQKYHRVIEGFFPRVQFAELDAGHWVHAEKPKEFLDVTLGFFRQ